MINEKPTLIFDVIETIFSLEGLSHALTSEGLPDYTKDLFFAQLLRDAFASSATGAYISFVDMARGTLQVVLSNLGVTAPEPMIERILPVFGQLEAHPDVTPALELAKNKGVNVLFFTNGSERNTRALIDRNELGELVDHVVSIDDFQQWKPAKTAYLSAIRMAGAKPAHSAMIAAHAWDTSGAQSAGLLTGWVRRQDQLFHPAMPAPSFTSDNLTELVDEVSERLLAAR